ncbi:MAG TPA: HAMP domain-containing protein [Firmicutes bacterium]|jgi:signal transduction histidine kinase|nr:HAMP domain-containing protein [Bacillota bacterium]
MRRLNIWQVYFLGFIILIILVILITSFVVIGLFNTGIERQSEFTINKELDTANKVFYTQLDSLFHYFDSPSFLLFLQDALGRKADLDETLAEIRDNHALSFLMIVKPDGAVVAGTNNSTAPCEKLPASVFLQRFLGEQSHKGIIPLDKQFLEAVGLSNKARIRVIRTPEAREDGKTNEARGLAQVISIPLGSFAGSPQAYLLGGKLINRSVKFVDEVSDLLKVYATIFLDDVRISTSIRLDNGNRALGTRVSREVADTVLDQGKRYLGEATIIGEKYLTAYDPIRDDQGNVIGILFVGIPKAPFTAMKENTLRQYIYISLFSIFLALLIAYTLSRKITGPLQRLTRTMKKVELGDLSQRFATELSSGTHPGAALPHRPSDGVLSPPQDEIEMLGNIFDQMMSSLQRNWEENLKLQANLEEKEKNRLKLLKKLIFVQEEERKRVARELHDGTSQSLTSLMLILKAIQKSEDLEEIRKLAETYRGVLYNTLEEIQKISYELRPMTLDKLGIDEAIKRYIGDLAQHSDINIVYDNKECVFASFDQEIETTAYRIVQEALTNAVRHAQPQNIEVVLRSDDQGVEVIVKDDGLGFEVEKVTQNWENALGILGMMERASLLRGELKIDSAPGRGTTVILRLPLNI